MPPQRQDPLYLGRDMARNSHSSVKRFIILLNRPCGQYRTCLLYTPLCPTRGAVNPKYEQDLLGKAVTAISTLDMSAYSFLSSSLSRNQFDIKSERDSSLSYQTAL